MKYSLLLAALLSASSVSSMETVPSDELEMYETMPEATAMEESPFVAVNNPANSTNQTNNILRKNSFIRVSVIGQGVSPLNTSSPAQAYALAKRAAIADSYRLVAEKIKGVHVDGQDTIKNMMIKRSTVRVSVNAMVRNASIIETTFKDGLCEVEMEILVYHSQFAQ